MSLKFSFEFTIKIPIPFENTLPAEVEKYYDEGFSLIAAWRRYRGLSQVEVAIRAGKPWPTYSNNERGIHKPSELNLQKIANALEIWASQLIE